MKVKLSVTSENGFERDKDKVTDIFSTISVELMSMYEDSEPFDFLPVRDGMELSFQIKEKEEVQNEKTK